MPVDSYASELLEIARCLKKAGFDPSIRGEYAARFVYVEHQRRAAEVSKAEEGWFVELWEEPSEISIRDEVQDTIPFAVEQVLDWLRNQ